MVPIDVKWIGYLPVVVGAAVVGTAVVVASGTIRYNKNSQIKSSISKFRTR